MKRLTLIFLAAISALLLNACGARSTISNWPGLAADADRAYLANGPQVHAIRLSDQVQVWQYPEKADAHAFISNPVLTPDGQLLVSSAGLDNSITSLDPATGREKWAQPITADNHWVASPLVLGDAVYAANNNGSLYAADLVTGEIKWSLKLDGALWSAPTTNRKFIYVTSVDHSLYAIDPESQSVVWKVDLQGSAQGSAAVSEDGTTVYVGSLSKKVFAIDADTGAVRWSSQTSDWVWGTPILDGETLYAADLGGRVYALATADGTNAWTEIRPAAMSDVPYAGPITASPLIYKDGVIVAAAETGSIYAFDGSGKELWPLMIDGQIYTTPVAAGKWILVAPMRAKSLLYAVNPETHAVEWQYPK